MKNNFDNLKKLKIYILTAHSHNGLDWIHSLFDSHKEILIMPGFSFMRTITIYKIDLINYDNSKIAKTFSDIFYKIKAYKLQRRNFIRNLKQRNFFYKKMLFYLNTSNEVNIFKKSFFSIHYAFAELYKIDISKKKILIAQEHVSWHCEFYEKTINPHYLFVIRDFRAAFAGSLNAGTKINKIKKITSNQFDKVLINWILGTRFIKKLRNSKNKNYTYIINEKMNYNLEKEMKKLCKNIKVNFYKSSLKQTFLGKEWYGESSYLMKNIEKGTDLNKKAPKDYYLLRNVKKRWSNFLSQKEISIFNSFLNEELVFFKYSKSKTSFLRYIYSIVQINFIYLLQDKYFFNTQLIILRNIVRRFLVINFPKISLKIFNIY